MDNDFALLRLLQLVSPGLPIGMYSYSQGLERAVDEAWVHNSDTAATWLDGILQHSIGCVDVPILLRLYEAWQTAQAESVSQWSQTLRAYRETSELRAEDCQMGQALAKLLTQLNIPDAQLWQRHPQASLATLFSLAAVQWHIDVRSAALAYVWGWLENQVLCTVKLIPLGQVAGQQLLQTIATQIPALVDNAFTLNDDDIGGSAFALALASSRHEIQYSRLFRS